MAEMPSSFPFIITMGARKKMILLMGLALLLAFLAAIVIQIR